MTATPMMFAEQAGRGSGAVVESPRFIRRLLRQRLAVACLAYLAIITGVAVVAPILLPEVAREHAGDILAARQGPSAQHLLGTDTVGRDVLQRLLVGTQPTMIAVFLAVLVAFALGLPCGLLAGYFGKNLDRVIGWLADLTFAMPAIVIVLVVLAVFPQNMAAAMVTLGVITAPGLMRLVRSATLPVREELYVASARVSGLSSAYIVTRHILPRVVGPVIVQVSLLAAVALQVQTGLAFLGLLTPSPAPSWGGMVADGTQVIDLQPWLIWPPGLAIAVTILAFGLLGDAVRDATTQSWSPQARRRQPRRSDLANRPQAESPPGIGADVLLSMRGLCVAFAAPAGPARVLDDVSLDVRRGEIVGLVGESGCGKTLTAMAILGLLPGTGRIDAGEIWFDGRNLVALRQQELRRLRGKRIGLISQEPMTSLNPAFRIGWQLAEAVHQHQGISRRRVQPLVHELLRRVRLPDPEAVARRYPHELSGGMAQRVAIARALAGEPDLLIADEPTTALDVTVQAEILDLLRDLQHDRQVAILLVTHDWGVIADICDRTVVMYAGQVVEHADMKLMFRQPLHPYTKALMAADPHNNLEAEALPAIPGGVPVPGHWPSGCHFHPRCLYATALCGQRPIRLAEPVPGRATRCLHHDQLSVIAQEGA